MSTRFEDPDGNSFTLVGLDEVSRALEDQRRALAEKVEAERRVAQEMEIARQVQARLFPQTLPGLRTLEYAGVCMQARQVGGDYYDFLNLGQERLGLIIGDIAGKGIAAALLMANLQANLRSQCAIALDRRDGKVECLDSTATVLGLFDRWDCLIRECSLAPADLLVLYTDGVTESRDDRDEEFGEERLVEALRRYRSVPAGEMVKSVVNDVRAFSPHEQSDDITLIVARCR